MLAPLIAAGAQIGASLLNRQSAKEAAEKNAATQREFAQSGIQWKVEDAKKAGIHPLYALGASTTSFSPSYVGSNYDKLADAGQNIGRALDSSRTSTGKAGHLATVLAETQIEGAKLDNEIKKQRLASDMATTNQPGNRPSIPAAAQENMIEGQGNTPARGQLKFEKSVNPAAKTGPTIEAGENPEVSFYRSGQNAWAPQIPKDLSEPFERDWLSYYQWYTRNKLLPGIADGRFTPPPWVKLAEDEEWKYSPFMGEYVVRKKQGGYYDETGTFHAKRSRPGPQ